MNNDYTTLVSIISKIIMLGLIFPVLPIILKETNVPNGLGMLRKLIFSSIISFIVANGSLLLFQIARLFVDVSQLLFDLASILNSCATIITGIVLYIIYSGRYRNRQ